MSNLAVWFERSSVDPYMDRSRQAQTGQDMSGCVGNGTGQVRSGKGWSGGSDGSDQVWMCPNEAGRVQMGLDQSGWVWTG